MTPKRLDRLGVTIDSALGGAGFALARGMYRRARGRLNDGIVVDLDRPRRAFRVLLGLNSPVLFVGNHDYQNGFVHHVYLRGLGVGIEPRNWPCANDREAQVSLNEVATFLETTALAWFDRFRTLSDLAEALPPVDDYQKGLLLAADGRHDAARPWLERYRDRVITLPESPERTSALTAVEAQLRRNAGA